MDEIRKSINSILYERATSPFFGTLTLSWLVWNWRIIYLTFFISESQIKVNKIDFIAENYSNIHQLLTFPLLSTIVLITVVPFISNGAYWLALRFRKWRIDQRNEIEMKQLLTIEQSIELREEIRNQQNRFEELLKDKNLEIEQLTKALESVNSQPSTAPSNSKTKPKSKPKEVDTSKIQEFFQSEYNLEQFKKVVWVIQNSYGMYAVTNSADPGFVSYLESNDLIQQNNSGKYKFTDEGKHYYKFYSELALPKK